MSDKSVTRNRTTEEWLTCAVVHSSKKPRNPWIGEVYVLPFMVLVPTGHQPTVLSPGNETCIGGPLSHVANAYPSHHITEVLATLILLSGESLKSDKTK